LEDFSSGCSSGLKLGQCLIAGILAIFTGISRLLPVTRWLSVTLSPDVPVVSTVGASSLKSSAWREKWGMFPIFFLNRRWRIPVVRLLGAFPYIFALMAFMSVGNVYAKNCVHEDYCTTENPFYKLGYGGQCTSYAWGRAYGKMGVSIQFTQNSGRHGKNWYQLVKSLPRGRQVQDNSIAVFAGDSSNSFGHVAYVESVNNGKVYFTEANVSTYSKNNGNYGGGKDGGEEKNKTIQGFENRGKGIGKIVGYIYLQQAPTLKLDSSIKVEPNPVIQGKWLKITAKISNRDGTKDFNNSLFAAFHPKGDVMTSLFQIELKNQQLPAGHDYEYSFGSSHVELSPGEYDLYIKEKRDDGSYPAIEAPGSLQNPITVKVVGSETDTDTDNDNTDTGNNAINTDVAENAYDGNWDVPYLSQVSDDYAWTHIRESACGPTSVAMLLRFYFPNSHIDMPEVYQAGTQTYTYHGPAIGYRNISFASGKTGNDGGTNHVGASYRGNYSGNYSGMTLSAMEKYLQNIWGIRTKNLYSVDEVYTALRNGPLLGHVYAYGNSKWGHYIVIRGIDEKGTISRNDDMIYINDPYDENNTLSYSEFFKKGQHGNAWFRDAVQLTPNETAKQREYTVIVDTGHNTFAGGNNSHHHFHLQKVNGNYDKWKYYYGGGDWYYPTENGHAARWSPKLAKTGYYQVSVKFRGDKDSGKVPYTIYSENGDELVKTVVNQHRVPAKWDHAILAESVLLENGAYVRASDIPAGSNIDAIKFKYLRPADDDNSAGSDAGSDAGSGDVTDSDDCASQNETPSTTNPTRQNVSDEILCLAKEYNIPPVIIQAIAFKESGWDQIRNGSVVTNHEPDGREGIGIMQVTKCPPKPKPDTGVSSCTGSISQAAYNQLKNDWRHNLAVGIETLNSKWKTQNSFVGNSLNAIDKGILENWYYPVMWYNGEGKRAETYVADAFSRMENSPAHLTGYWDDVTDINNPTKVVVMRKADGKGEAYELTDLINKGVTLHYWNSTTGEYFYLTSLSKEEYANRETSWPPSHATKGNSNGTTVSTVPVDEPPPSIIVRTLNKENGDIQISATGLGAAGTVKVDGKEVQGEWTSDGINLNLFDTTGITLESIEQPLHIEAFDNTGNKVVDGYYPFMDVPPDRWDSKPILKLWKEGIINGYGGDWAGYFKPSRAATRQEYVAVTVKASHSNTRARRTSRDSGKPFEDIELDNGFIEYIQTAKDLGIVSGCNEAKTMFCPERDTIRVEALKMTLSAFDKFKEPLKMFTEGHKVPTREFTDVKNKGDWYYPFVYTAQDEEVVHGYKDGSFKPTKVIKRNEMAKILCVAAFGPMECLADIVAKTPVDTTEPDDEADSNLPDESDTDGTDDSGDTTPDDGETGTGDDDGSDTDGTDDSGDTTPDDGETGTGDADELADDLDPDDNKPGDETAALRLKDGSIATNCTFSDITDDNWFVVPVKAFCSAGIIIGYSESGKRVYKPTQEANLVETLKVLLYASDYERIGEQSVGSDPWYKFFLNDAKDKGLSVDETKIGEPVTRLLAWTYLAKLFYGYTGPDLVQFLVDKDITSGKHPDYKLNRAELVTLAYRAANNPKKDIHYGLVDSPPDAEPDTSSDYGQAVANKANDKVGVKFPYVDKKYTYCARFARSMHGKPAKWPDAKGMCNYFQGKGLMKTDGEPTEGAVVCYLPGPSNWNYGHVAIAVGDNKEVGATSLRYGVTKRDIRFGAGYQGWVTADDYNNNYPQ